SGGGAGIQADLKTFAALGVYGMSALTSITAQSTVGVQGIYDLPAQFVGLQIDSVIFDLGVDAVKTGMLSNAEIIEVVAAKISQYRLKNLVVDPVMVAKSGASLLREEAQAALISRLVPLARVITPNLPEARVLSGLETNSLADMAKAAEAIKRLGAACVVVKGGHLQDMDESIDLLYDGERLIGFVSPRIATRNTHGTGCTFASAIAAGLAKGQNVTEAVRVAKEYVTMALQHSLSLGQGHGPLDHFASFYQMGGFIPSGTVRVVETLDLS
ncbi:MAG: bifunctional hydroxymethylpyrimidine kinase/phosphomethylpyrimidine kinase, partial [Chloroflexi bacterium]|nr:bifunctional hydroxymethylpyrimidine kinase/phosphomethylpyrimidine kinase [Chloroflexota bacterium]